jgi:hypothetical protein
VSEPEPQEWRVAMFGRVLATAIAAGPAVSAGALWARAALHPSVDRSPPIN